MTADDLNIESLLEFSIQQDELVAGHQKEMSQVLANKERLQKNMQKNLFTRMRIVNLKNNLQNTKNSWPNSKPKT